MSNINYTAININYPVVGVDNDSQGFRDNFQATQLGLQTAKTEITKLQTNGLFSSSITASTPTPIVNNLLQSVISNGSYLQFTGIYSSTTTPVTNATSAQVDLNQGPVQKFTVAGSGAVFSFVNWPRPNATLGYTGVYSVLRLILIGDQNNAISNSGNPYTVSFNNASGSVKLATGFSPISIRADGKYEIVEVFTFNAGTDIFIRNVGEF
jgi:hypothetical protein